MIKLNKENYQIKKNLEKLQNSLELEKKAKETALDDMEEMKVEAELKITEFETSMNSLKMENEQLRNETNWSNNDLVKQKQELQKTLAKLEASQKALDHVNIELRNLKEGRAEQLGDLELKYAEQTEKNQQLSQQLSEQLAAREKAEQQLKVQLEANKKLSLLSMITKDKNDKRSTVEKDLLVQVEENKVLEQLRRKADERIRRLEAELGTTSAVQTRLEKELVGLRRENFQKDTILGEVRVQMAEFETKWRFGFLSLISF